MLKIQTTWERVTSSALVANSNHGMNHRNSQKVVYEKNQFSFISIVFVGTFFVCLFVLGLEVFCLVIWFGWGFSFVFFFGRGVGNEERLFFYVKIQATEGKSKKLI